MATGEGFHDFHRDAYPRLVAQLYAVTTDPGLAEDVVQEAFVRAASRWAQVRTCPGAGGVGPQGGAAVAPGRRAGCAARRRR